MTLKDDIVSMDAFDERLLSLLRENARQPIATLARAYPGRFRPGIGHGVPAWTAQMGLTVASPMSALRETLVGVRSLLSGAKVTDGGAWLTESGAEPEQPATSSILDLHLRYAALCQGDFKGSAPLAWLVSREGKVDEGRLTLAWGFGWSPGEREGVPLKSVPYLQQPAPVGKYHVEIFGGRDRDRMELLAQADDLHPGGTVAETSS